MIAKLRALERNTWLFFFAQGLGMTTLNVNVIIVGLAGLQIAPRPWLATLPLSAMFIASMMTTLPASLLMGRVGRKPVFIAGVCLVACGMAGQGTALLLGNFPMFLCSSMFVGASHGILQFYRYAAADTVPEERKPVVVSLVLAGGLVAAFLGANIVIGTIGFFPHAIYASCFYAAAMLQVIAMPVILLLRAVPPPERKKSGGRPLGYFFRRPRYLAGLASAALGFSVMTLLMTAAPLQMVNVTGLTNADNAHIIQWHVVAMFAPSFFTGALIRRFGADRIIASGLIAYGLAVVLLLSGVTFWHYAVVLFLVGLGWNALYVTGSSIIAAEGAPVERARVQGVSDFIITFCITTASLSAGVLHYTIGWETLGLGALLPVMVIGGFTAFAVVYERRMRVAG